MTSQLVGADYTDGALLPNYVNGRVLVAEDLATGQASLRTRDQRVGETAGAGVVRGLWVSGSQTTLSVDAGLAMSAAGEPVVVARPVTLQLTFVTTAAMVNRSDFSCCTPDATDGQGTDLAAGILLLVARPACRLDGRAPTAGPPTGAESPGCAARWQVEGVEFRAVALPVPAYVAGEQLTSGNRRNLVAHWCYGTEQLDALGADPFGFPTAWTGFDELSAADLTAYDVPLAAFSWDGSSIADLDNWAARRRVSDPRPVPSSWAVTVSDRRLAEGEARFLQFQDQAEELVSRGLAGSAVAPDHFGLLPPVGFLPVANQQFAQMAERAYRSARTEERKGAERTEEEQVTEELAGEWAKRFVGAPEEAAATTGTGTSKVYSALGEVAESSVGYGYDPEEFFGPLARLGGFVDWELAEWALEQSWRRPPVSTSQDVVDDQVDEVPGMETHVDPNRLHRIRQSPITYYYVLPNLLSAAYATKARRQAAKKRRAEVGLSRSNLYVVFTSNIQWALGSEPPAIPYPLSSFLR